MTVLFTSKKRTFQEVKYVFYPRLCMFLHAKCAILLFLMFFLRYLYCILVISIMTVYFALGSSYRESMPEFSVKGIICPNSCKGERLYSVIFEAAGVVQSDRGMVQNDTISAIDPKADYQLTVTINSINGKTFIQVIQLPVCDPIIPAAASVTSQRICEGEAIPPLNASTGEGITVDWYGQMVGGTPLATSNLQYTPDKPGVYYAQARFLGSDCQSFSRTAATVEIKKMLCPIIQVRKIRP